MDSEVAINDVKGQPNVTVQPEAEAKITKTEVVLDEKAPNINKDINNQIENIISDIDINIKAQEKITQLKEQELQLIQKQQELAQQIQQQQILAQKLIAQNRLKEQELQAQQSQQQQILAQKLIAQNQLKEQELQAQQSQQLEFQKNAQYTEAAPVPRVSQEYTTKVYNTQEDTYDIKETSNVSRTVDLRKIFTPATDAPEILPKNRKLYASSAFYSPSLHPTVEDQVQLARRISHSLSDISNQKSKGQSMYVNRKKRSVKWVHEGCGQGEDDIVETHTLYKENSEANSSPELTQLDKMPLKLIMNPRGQMRDYNSLKDSINIETGLLSPDNCAELITALQLHKGRGAELFAKRRKRAENWVVDETNAGIHSPSGIPDYHQYQAKPSTSPSILPAYSDAGKHRVQLNIHQDQLIEKYSKPGVQVVKSPWEAALQTGSASTAFLEHSKYRSQTPLAAVPSPVHFNRDVTDYSGSVAELPSSAPASYGLATDNKQNTYNDSYDMRIQSQSQQTQPFNPQRELAYKPSVAQGWGGRNVELPKGLYVPKEISLASYAPPPVQARNQQPTYNNYQGPTRSTPAANDAPSAFPVSNPTSGLYSSVPPKQQLYGAASYQKVPPSSMQAAPQVNFNPSPLSFEKLSKFQESEQRNTVSSNLSDQRYLNVNNQAKYGVRNASPTPFGSSAFENRVHLDNSPRLPMSPNPTKPISPQFGQAPYSVPPQRTAAGQSFNNCARGWSAGSKNAQRNVFGPQVTVPANSMPYSDF